MFGWRPRPAAQMAAPEPAAAEMDAPQPSAKFAVSVPAEMLQAMTGGGAIAPRISRAEALQVTAVLRARNLICGSLATLPIRVHGPDRRVVDDVTYLPSGNIDPNIANSVVKAQLLEDLLFEGIAWLRVTKVGWHGYPVEAQHVPVDSVHVAPAGSLMPSQAQISPDQPFPADGQVYIDGRPVDDREVIRFDSPNPPLLRHAARAIRTCLLLDQTAALYVKDPMPLGYFAPKDGADEPDDDDVQEMLDDWEAARAKRAWGYVSGDIEPKTLQWSPEQLQLAAQRQHAVLEVARATGLDAEDLQVSVTSRTYANQEQRWQALLNTSFGGYVSAVQERLSMRDVLPRGYEARIDFGGFLRGDAMTRMQTYKAGREVGAYDDERIADLEDLPVARVRKATSKQQSQPAAPPATAPEPTPPGSQQERREDRVGRDTVNFDAGDPVQLQFVAPDPQDFQVDPERRTITGLLLPWGKVANNGMGKWRFAKDSVSWSEVSRIKLNQHHDSRDLIGVATRLQSSSRGLMGTFKVGRGPEGDRALEKAEDGILDGFSVEVDFDSFDSWQPDPTDESVRLVRQANLRGVAITGTPAFDDARLTSVKASRDQKGNGMPEDKGNGQPQTFDFEGFVSGLTDSMKESQKTLVEQLGQSIGESVSAGFKVALENIAAPQDGPQPVRAARYTVTREAPIYALNGVGPSLVRDGWYAAHHRDDDAIDRLRKFRMQTEDLSKLTHSELARQKFATVTTGNASQVIPPGYRPDLFVPMLAQGRPLVSATSRGVIGNATPFVVPVFGSVSGGTADHVEGTNPTDGTLVLTTKTITPGAISGSLVLTREIVDSSNPAIDQIALNAMMESYNRQTETKVYTLLNGASGAGGTITAGFVPSGAQAATFASTGGTPFAEAALIKGMRQQLAKYPFARFASPSFAFMGQNATSIIAGTMDSTGRPIFPSVGAQNSIGTGNAITQGWDVDGLAFRPAWAMTGQAAGDSQMLIGNELDVWAWESPLLTFRFEEKQGPAKIELDLFGYFGTHLLRPVGVSGLRIT
ncbi:phage portal protein [Micromonospora sp. NPDC047548]|uniref:phage portal protein n=1 Tax=Micromonospora sp. NPDC047548 TaxID=3155624 RepID=UPI0033ED612D